MVNKIVHADRHNTRKIEFINAIDSWELDFYTGNIAKHIARYRYKQDPIADLKKAKWYLQRLIELGEKESMQTK